MDQKSELPLAFLASSKDRMDDKINDVFWTVILRVSAITLPKQFLSLVLNSMLR